MDEQENPAVVQAVMQVMTRQATMDMTRYYSHSRRGARRAAHDKVIQFEKRIAGPRAGPASRAVELK
jgi:hypothetical protein